MYCDNFIKFLPILGLCGYKNLVLKSLKDEVVQDYINYDSPYIKSKINEIINELS